MPTSLQMHWKDNGIPHLIGGLFNFKRAVVISFSKRVSLHEEVLGLPSLKFAEFQAEEGNQGAVSGLVAIESGRFDQVPYKFEASLSVPYITIGQPERWVELCRNMIARWPDAHMYALARLVLALTITGAGDEACGHPRRPHGRFSTT